MEEARKVANSMEKYQSKEQKKRSSKRHRNGKEQFVHFATLMDICHLKNSELELQFQKYRGRVVLRGHIVKTILALMQYLHNKVRLHLK